MNKLLDKNGLLYLWSKIKVMFNGKADKGHTHTASEVGALPLTGGTVTGKTTYSGGLALTKAESNSSMEYFLGIKAFAAGGDVQWIAKSAVCADIGAATMSQVNTAIKNAITDAMNEGY